MKRTVLVALLVAAGCGPAAEPVPPDLKRVEDVGAACDATCHGAGYPDGRWCVCPNIATMVCFCHAGESAPCAIAGCSDL